MAMPGTMQDPLKPIKDKLDDIEKKVDGLSAKGNNSSELDTEIKSILNSATLLIVSGHCGQNRPECDFSCSNRLFAIS